MLPEIFKDAKVGDEVFSPDYGWGKIDHIVLDDKFPIRVGFSGTDEDYTITGRFLTTSPIPTCWPSHLVPQYYLDLCPRPIRKVVKRVDLWANIYPKGEKTIHQSSEEAMSWLTRSKVIAAAVHLTGTYEVEE